MLEVCESQFKRAKTINEEQRKATEIEKYSESKEKQNGYRVMTPEDVNAYKEWVKKKIPEWHDNVKPDYIILTETSGTPLGWVLKSAWKARYSNEKPPAFFRSDIGSSDIPHMAKSPKIIKRDFIDKRGIDESKIVLIYDEASGVTGHINEKLGKSFELRLDKPVQLVDQGNIKDEDARYRTLEKNAYYLAKAGIKNIWVDNVAPDNYFRGTYLGDYDPYHDSKSYVKPTRKRELSNKESTYAKANYIGVTEKNPELRKRALDYIHDLKLLGKEAGIELLEVLENKEN